MTTLILLIYLADITSSLSLVLLLLSIITGIAGISTLIYYLTEHCESKVPLLNHKKVAKILLAVSLISAFTIAVLPSKQTIYIASALYVGKEAVESNLGKKVLIELERHIDEAIAAKQLINKK